MDRQRLSVCFADLTNWVRLVEAAGDEGAVALLQEIFQETGDSIVQYDGRIRKYIGDAVLFTFTDPRQAIAAAHEIAAQRREAYGLELRRRVGVATGDVLVVSLGHPSLVLEDIMGATVNRAALLIRDAGRSELGVALCEETQKYA